MSSPHGGKWWDVGYGLGYAPYEIQHVQQIRYGRLREGNRAVLAAKVEGQWVAVNLPRSDVPGLQKAGLWPQGVQAPYEQVKAYAKPPSV